MDADSPEHRKPVVLAIDVYVVCQINSLLKALDIFPLTSRLYKCRQVRL